MAGKRQATSHLDHTNWAQEDEPEERGTFKTAPPEELKARVIKKATRRQQAAPTGDIAKDKDNTDAADTPRKSVFSGFSGFGTSGASTSSGAASGSPFAFLSHLSPAASSAFSASASGSGDGKRRMISSDANFMNDLSTSTAAATTTTTSAATTSIFGNIGNTSTDATKSPKASDSMFKSAVDSVEKPTTSNSINGSFGFRNNVATLNLAVMKFLQMHMDQDPYCILTPVFESYDKYLKELKQIAAANVAASSTVGKQSTSTSGSTATATATVNATPPSLTAASTPGFSFGKPSTSIAAAPPVTAASSTAAASFSFGKPSTSASSAAPSSPAASFSFGKPITSNAASTATSAQSSAVASFSFGKSSTVDEIAKPAPPAASFSFSKASSEIGSKSLPSAPEVNFSFGKPSTPLAAVNAADSASPSLAFPKKPNCTVTSGGSTSTVTAPLFSISTVQKANASPTKSEATSSTAPSSIFGLGLKSTATARIKDELPKTGFFFGSNTNSDAATASTSLTKTNGFSFGLNSGDDKPSTSGFTGFGKAAAGETKMPAPSGLFSGAASTFSFANLKPPAPPAADSNAADEEDEDTPPVVQFNKVVEDDAIFSKRCKVFVKKGMDFTDRGVGTLYLKPVKDSNKTQLLVRADTNLGNILVNLILTEGLPSQRMGKNNVMMVCIPTPEESKAMSMLLRVKTGEEADELLEQIKKHTV